MSPLPTPDFQWLNADEISTFNVSSVPEDGDKGFVLEVDLTFPEELHDCQ